MNILHQVIAELSKEEVRHFKLYLTQTNNNDARKDIAASRNAQQPTSIDIILSRRIDDIRRKIAVCVAPDECVWRVRRCCRVN